MSFGESIRICFSKYVDFDGRASRSEYWWFFLFTALIYLSCLALIQAANTGLWFVLVILALFLPLLAVAVRRLHDTGKSGWWYWIVLVPYVGSIILLVLLAQPSQPFDNRYGPGEGSQMPAAPSPAPPTPGAPPPMPPRLDDRGSPPRLP